VTNKRPAGLSVLDAFIEAGNETGQHLASQRVHQDDGAFGLEFFAGLLTHAVLNARRTEHLQRAHVKKRCAGHRRSAAEALDRHRRNTVLREEHRGRETDQASAGEQDWNVFYCATRHGATS
jgi:hypothetical protein